MTSQDDLFLLTPSHAIRGARLRHSQWYESAKMRGLAYDGRWFLLIVSVVIIFSMVGLSLFSKGSPSNEDLCFGYHKPQIEFCLHVQIKF